MYEQRKHYYMMHGSVCNSLRNIFKRWASLHAEMEMAVMFFPFHSLCDYLSTVTGFEVDKVWPTTCTRGHLSAAVYCKTAQMLLTNTRFYSYIPQIYT